jgi:hypothetical protein
LYDEMQGAAWLDECAQFRELRPSGRRQVSAMRRARDAVFVVVRNVSRNSARLDVRVRARASAFEEGSTEQQQPWHEH